jgi:hypothetical protein
LYTAAELILALQRRLLLISPHKRRPAGEFPPGWQSWFAAMGERVGAVTGATTTAITDVLLQRPLTTPPRRTQELTQWQAFSTLWRQQWHAPEPEDRRVRWFAGIVTVLWHLFFSAMLLWLMYLRFIGLQAEAAARKGEEEVVQIEYIGRGTPEEIGGGPQPAPAAEAEQAPAESAAEASSAPPMASAAPGPSLPSPEAPIPDVPQRDVPEPQIPPTPPVDQVVEVSAPTPETADFVLPPPTPRVSEPQLTVPELTAPTRQVQAVDVLEPMQPIRRELPQREIATPQVAARVPDVAVREVPAPLRHVPVREIATPALTGVEVRAPSLPVRAVDVPSPRSAATSSATTSSQSPTSSAQRAPASSSASPSSAAAASTASASSAASTSRPSGTARSPASSAGSGPQPTPAPGSFPTPARADDWGASTRNVPGGQRGQPSGLYNADGTPKLGEQPVNPGQPPGTFDDRIADLDKSGTWLKRKPTDYEPTTLDKYWVPHETLLQEWVRKGVKSVAIPIPGTSKKLNCVVSILQFGGGCALSDDNLNEQSATARPPPDIPFKPELQEDNGSVKPPPKP